MGSHVYSKFPPDYNFGGAKVLIVGCGFGHFNFPNVTHLDAFDVCKPDVVWDLNKTPLPFEDETFDFILANHVLEHVFNWWECFNDLARVLKTGGKMEVWVPGSGSDTVRGYRDHVHEINSCSFFGVHGTYASGSNSWAAENAACMANRLVTIEQMRTLDNQWWIVKAPDWLRHWMFKHLRNIAAENGYRFQKISVATYEKEQRKLNESKRNGYPQPKGNPAIPV